MIYIYLLILSLIFNLNYNLHAIHGKFHFLAAISIVFVQFLILSINKNIFSIFFPFIIFLSSIASYFIKNFKIPITANSIGLVFETSIEEASGFVGWNMVFYVIGSTLLSIIAVIIFRKIYKKDLKFKLCLTAILLIILPIFKKFHYTTQLLPHIIFEKSYKYALERYKFSKLSAKIRKEIKFKYLKSPSIQKEIVVLVIGEAARADHFHINGYYRETSPELEKIDNLISFKKFYSCDITTRKSIPCFMTRATEKNRIPTKREKSVISIFKKAGFYTYWISNQRKLGKYDSSVTLIAKEADFVKFNNPIGDLKNIHIYDENLLPILKKILNDKKHKKKFIVLHTIGSHWHYEKHYPEAFRKFKPICKNKIPAKCGMEKVVNSYDNTILYTDFVLSKIIKILSNYNSILIYVSDHGEELGENGIYGHGQKKNEYQTHIGAFLWISKNLLNYSEFKKYYQNAKSKENKLLSHEWVFYSLIGCSGIKTDIINNKLNLCE